MLGKSFSVPRAIAALVTLAVFVSLINGGYQAKACTEVLSRAHIVAAPILGLYFSILEIIFAVIGLFSGHIRDVASVLGAIALLGVVFVAGGMLPVRFGVRRGLTIVGLVAAVGYIGGIAVLYATPQGVARPCW